MPNKEDYVLWLPSWYPNKTDLYVGDFIQRHARATALLHKVLVLYVIDADIKTSVENTRTIEGNLTEEIVYFKSSKAFQFKIVKQFIWFYLYRKSVKSYIAKFGKPVCVHVNVAWKAGLIAMWIKRKYNIPYVITEHWGIYNNVVKDNYSSKPSYFRQIVKKIYRNANYFLSVSKYLAEGISTLVEKKPFAIIPNVVDTTLFYYSHKAKSIFTFLHVSNMVELKNIPGILRAFKSLIGEGSSQEIQLIFVGNRYDEYHKLASDLGLYGKYVFFKGEISYDLVADEMRAADCLILNSNIENSPCVIGEALCCGMPVIATNVGGIPEIINKGNGILIEPNDDLALVNAMKTMILNSNTFNREENALQASKKFNYLTFSETLNKVYKNIRSKKDIS